MTDEILFFRYQPISKYTLCNLSKNQLYFNHPTDFNDPFDSFCCLTIKGTKEQLINWYSHAKPCASGEARIVINNCINEQIFVKRGYIYTLNTQLKNSNEFLRDLHGSLKKKDLPRVCCLSKKDEDILMWSHYADYHKGICLRFKFSEKTLEKLNGNIRKVDYKSKLDCFNILDSDTVSKVNEMIYQKFCGWEYEEEYRIVYPASELNNNMIKYEKSDLEGVVFGLRVNYEDTKQIYDVIKKNYPDEKIKFYRAKQVLGEYKLENEIIPSDFDVYLNTLEHVSESSLFEC